MYVSCSLCFEKSCRISPRKRECVEFIHTWEGCRKPVGAKLVSSLGYVHLTSEDLGFALISWVHLRNAVVIAEPLCNSDEWNLPHAPLQRSSNAILIRTMNQVFLLRDKSKCWSHAGLLLWVCLTCKPDQHHTAFMHLLWIKLVHADQPSWLFYCCSFSGLCVPFCLLMVSAFHSIWLQKHGVYTKTTLENKIKRFCGGNYTERIFKGVIWRASLET